jgi:DNA-binding transcriptional LysR family regulator
LRYFVMVAELRSMSKASTALLIAQPPLSKQIKDLEEEVGASLLIRSSRGVALTAAGEAFLKEARATLSQAEHAKFVARQVGTTSVSRLNIGFIHSASHAILPRLLKRLSAERPDLDIYARELLSVEQVSAMHSGTIDLGICRPPIDSSRLARVAALDDPLCLVVHETHWMARGGPVDLAQAAQEHFVSYVRDQPRAFFDQTQSLCKEVGFEPDIRFRVSSTYAVIDLVSAGCGIAIVPSSSAVFGTKSVVFRRLIKPGRPGSIFLMQRKRDTNPAITTAVEVIAKVFNEMNKEVAKLLM